MYFLSGWLDDLKAAATNIVTGSSQVTGAVNQVRAKVGEFLGLPARFDGALRKIDGEIARAGASTKWNALRQSVIVLQNQYPPLESRVSGILAKQSQGVSLALLAAAVPVSAEVAGMLAAMRKIESALSGVAAPGFAVPAVPLGLLAAAGVGVLLLLRRGKK